MGFYSTNGIYPPLRIHQIKNMLVETELVENALVETTLVETKLVVIQQLRGQNFAISWPPLRGHFLYPERGQKHFLTPSTLILST